MSADIVEKIIVAVKVPDETISEEQADKLHHRDVSARTEADLRRELGFVRWLLYIADSPWHEDRERVIGHELARRREAKRDEHRQSRVA